MKSKCCEENVNIKGNIPKAYFVCSKCFEPCEVWLDEPIEDDVNIQLKFIKKQLDEIRFLVSLK